MSLKVLNTDVDSLGGGSSGRTSLADIMGEDIWIVAHQRAPSNKVEAGAVDGEW